MSDGENRTTIIEAGSKGVASAAIPYVALGVVAYLGIKYLEGQDFDLGFPDVAGSINETITNITEVYETTTEKYYYGGEIDLIQGDGDSPENSKYEDILVKTEIAPGYMGFPESTNYLMDSASKTGLGKKTTTSIMPSLGGLLTGDVKILDNDYNNQLISEQISKYGDPMGNTGGTGGGVTTSDKTEKQPGGLTLTAAEVSSLKSSGKKPVTGRNTTGKPRVLSRPDSNGNRYDVTDKATSRKK